MRCLARAPPRWGHPSRATCVQIKAASSRVWGWRVPPRAPGPWVWLQARGRGGVLPFTGGWPRGTPAASFSVLEKEPEILGSTGCQQPPQSTEGCLTPPGSFECLLQDTPATAGGGDTNLLPTLCRRKSAEDLKAPRVVGPQPPRWDAGSRRCSLAPAEQHRASCGTQHDLETPTWL